MKSHIRLLLMTVCAMVLAAVPAEARSSHDVITSTAAVAATTGTTGTTGTTATTATTDDGVTAHDIIEKMDDLLRGKTNYSRMKMTIVTPSWKRTLEMDSWARGTDHSFIHILSPARERDTTFLKKGKLLYQYIPSAEMRIKISPSMMMQSWMGSDFTNDDLVRESSVVDDYTHELLPPEKLDGDLCWVIALTPKPDAAVVWGRIVAWVSKRTYLPMREDFFDEKGARVRTMVFGDFRQANDRLYPYTWSLVPLTKEGHRTVLETVDVKFDQPIPDRVFSLKNLEKPR